MKRAAGVVILLGCLSLFGAGAAAADEDSTDKAQARLLLAQGNALFERGDLRGALADFRAAYALYPSPKLLVNAAAAARELGDWASAATDLRHFLDDATDEEGALVDKARSDLKQLERKLARIGLGGWPARSTLELDGRPVRDPTYVRPGPHSLRGRSPSGVEESIDVEVAAGESFDLPVPAGALMQPMVHARPSPAAPPPEAKRSHRAAWVVPVAVVTTLLVAGGIATAVVLATRPTPQPLAGPVGGVTFSFR